MDREKIDQMWQQALEDAVRDGEEFTHHYFARMVAEECAKVAKKYEPDEKAQHVTYASQEILSLYKPTA